MKRKLRSIPVLGIILALLVASIIPLGCGESKPAAPAGQAPAANAPAKLSEVRVSHQPEFETYISYDAIQAKRDEKAGIKMNLVYFDSGMPQIEALPANTWDVGATGGVPMLMAALRYNAYLIGIANDESLANVVMARADSPVFQNKNANGTFGKADQIKGKNFLVTTVSSGHYALSKYLGSMGLKDSDVQISNLEQAQGVAAFDSGKGDQVALWSPFMYTGMKKGWKVVASGDQVGARIPLVIIANKKFADEHPDQVVKFLDVFFQGIDIMKKDGANQTDKYQAFLKDWAAMETTKEDAALDIKLHPVFDLKEQLGLFDKSKGQSEVNKWMQGIADFFTAQGKFTQADMDKVMKSEFINDKFIKELAKQKGVSQ